jgi:hypothetical protein
VWRTVDLVVRFLYVLIAPLVLVICAALFPITGTLISAALATLVAMFGADRWRASVERIPLVGRALGGMSRLGELYAEHPPKPLVYYVFYPLLLPVIVFLRVPRRELLLYRKLGALALAIIVGTSAYDYLRHWHPGLPFGVFVTAMITGLILQLLATFSMVMPIVTTFVMLHQRGRKTTIWILFAGTIASGLLGAYGAHKSHGMPIGTWIRIESRIAFSVREYRACAAAHPAGKDECGHENAGLNTFATALDEAYATLAKTRDESAAIDRARDVLGQFFKPDEAAEFQLFVDGEVAVLFVKFGRRPPLWLARDKTHGINQHELPASARKVLGL